MSDPKLAQFSGKVYLTLESYRKNGNPVRTPVWFVEDQGVLYLGTPADAGKVKRIRNNPRVRVVPSTARGLPNGDWIEARAHIVSGSQAEHANALLNQKYGWKRALITLHQKLIGKKRVIIAIDFS